MILLPQPAEYLKLQSLTQTFFFLIVPVNDLALILSSLGITLLGLDEIASSPWDVSVLRTASSMLG